MENNISTRTEYLELFPSVSEAISYEETCLSIGLEFLPPCAVAVIDGEDPTAEYWSWLAVSLEQQEHEFASSQA